jgi:glycosyltransferase involved in cell wall biosynthesis
MNPQDNAACEAPPDTPATVQFPRQGAGRLARRPEEVLLICYYDPAGISTVPETVAFMQSASRFAVTVVNLFEHRADSGFLRLRPSVDLDAYGAVVVHNTVSYNVDNLRSLDQGLARTLRDYAGVKILMKQDENYRFREVARYIGETGFDLVFTCLPPEAVPLVYPPEVVGKARFERMLTGYVTPTLRARRPAAGPRPIDIGYRGSIQPLSFGWLAYEKRKIGDDVARLLAGSGLALDISSRWEDRLGGDAWFDFLASCKATLGAESGASMFDLDGDLDERIARLEQEFAGLPTENERAEAVLKALGDVEDNIHYHQISPRHFEAAACGTVQLLYPGTYSGLLQPGRHFFPLERDCSNLDDAVAFLRDDARREEMARRAFDEVVLDPANWIESFVARVDDAIAAGLKGRPAEAQAALTAAGAAHNVLLVCAHDPVIDPRLGWVEEGATGSLRVHQLGVLPPGTAVPRMQIQPRGTFILAQARQTWQPRTALRYLAAVGDSPAGMAGVQELLFLQHAVQLPEPEFCALFGAPVGAERNMHFRWYLQYLLDTAESLLAAASQMRGVHALIATDLDTLPAALVLKALLGVPLLYDAHEYWPESDLRQFEFEKQFWIALERRMVPHADQRQTVSPGLAALMGRQYGVPFDCVPNCEPVDRLLQRAAPAARASGEVHFLFQGNFAPGRGLDLLVQAWPDTDPRAILQLRGPDNIHKPEIVALAEKTGLLGKRIFFPAAVPESEMIAAAARADVGLIPYSPASGTAYRNCCPNKLSQYMAAGLPILANATDFVATTVRAAGCGLVADFSRRDQLVRAVAQLCDAPERRDAWAAAGRGYFLERFNWNEASRGMYRFLAERVGACAPEPLVMYVRRPEAATTTIEMAVTVTAAAAPQPQPVVLPVLPVMAPSVPGASSGLAPALPLGYRAVRYAWRHMPNRLRRALNPIARRVNQRVGA